MAGPLRTRWSVIGLCLLALVVSVACSPGPPTTSDRDVVFCLAEEHRNELAAAAVALGLAESSARNGRIRLADGRELTPEQWRAERSADFRRACVAVAPTGTFGPPSSVPGWLAWAAPLAAALLAAVLTHIGARVRDVWIRAEQQARALRLALSAFVAATDSYVREQRSSPMQEPSGREVRDRRTDLRVELRNIALNRRGSQLPGHVIDTMLLGGELGEQLFYGWRANDADAKEERVRRALESLERQVVELAHAVEHPIRGRRTLQQRGATSGAR